jgi:hypothetical protein
VLAGDPKALLSRECTWENVHECRCRLNEISLTWGGNRWVVEGRVTATMLLAIAVLGYPDLLVIEAIDAA